MLALAGIIGYAAVSAYHRNCSARKVLSRSNTYGYTNVLVIYKSHWLCPNLEATVIGFKDNYIGDSEQNKLLNLVDSLSQLKPDSLMETTAFGLIDGKRVDGDGTIIYRERNWVFPALTPGGFSVFKYKRSPTTNKFDWNGSSRTWNDTQPTAPLRQPPQ
jgi:hypothetical protein